MTKYAICFDTICAGYAPVTDGDNNPLEFLNEDDALREIDDDPEFYDECFACPIDEIGYKTIYTGE